MPWTREENIFCFWTHVTAQLFLLTQYIYVGCLNIHGIHVSANCSTNNNAVFFYVSDQKLVYNNNNASLITIPWTMAQSGGDAE